MLDTATRRKIIALYKSQERKEALLIWDLIRYDLLLCKPISREQLTRYVRVVGGPTLPIPIDEQLTDRIPLEV